MEKKSSIQFVELSNKRKDSLLGICYDEEIKETRYDLREVLISYLAEEALDDVVAILNKHLFLLRIETPRKETLGLFSWVKNRICINNDLNKEQFLSVFIHEYAHFVTCLKFPKVKSHGSEFSYCFQMLALTFNKKDIIDDFSYLLIVRNHVGTEHYKENWEFEFNLSTIRTGGKSNVSGRCFNQRQRA